MIDGNICYLTDDFKTRLHLATGFRTDECEDFLNYFAQLNTRKKLFVNTVDFFNEYLNKIADLETDKEESKKQIQLLISEKEELFLTKYDLEKKLAEMSNALKKS